VLSLLTASYCDVLKIPLALHIYTLAASQLAAQLEIL
jgi:hypothetical protein